MWIALFSQTGSEICNIAERINRWPDIILTNNKRADEESDSRIANRFLILPHDEIEHKLSLLAPGELVTLHGYLRVLSPRVCNLPIQIYNGHPAPIHLYPTLKGLNKQEDLFAHKDQYARYGSVVHRVTAVLDDGEIIESVDRANDITSIDDAYSKAKETSLECWLNFFDKLKNGQSTG